jgi:tetratricopeptide (TPR) repeat protein
MWQDSIAILRFNIARCHEAQGATESALEGYNAILQEHADFVDCYLRIGYILAARGKHADSEKKFLECAELEEGKQEAWTALCMSKLRRKDWSKAKVLSSMVDRTANELAIMIQSLWLSFMTDM